MGFCATSSNGPDGIKFKFKKRKRNYKRTKEDKEKEKKLFEKLDDMVKCQMPNADKIQFQANIDEKREIAVDTMDKYMMKYEKEIKENQDKCDIDTIEVKVRDGTTIKVYILRPKTLTDMQAPALVFARGEGALKFESGEFNQWMCVNVVSLNCVIFNVDARKLLDARCPTGQQDLMDAFLYIHENSSTYRIDQRRLAMGGIGEGGWMTVGAANLMVKSGDIIKVNSLFVNYGNMYPTKVQNWEEHDEKVIQDHPKDIAGLDIMFDMLGVKEVPPVAEQDQLFPGDATPELLMRYPPVVIFTAQYDFFKIDNENFAKRCKDVGRLVDISILPGTGHALCGAGPESKERTWALEDFKKSFDAVCVPQKLMPPSKVNPTTPSTSDQGSKKMN